MALGFEDPGEFKVRVMAEGGVISEWEYDMSGDAPEKPDTPEKDALPGTIEEAHWLAYKRHQEAILWHKERRKLVDKHIYDVTEYILANCVSDEDRDKIGFADMDALRKAALIPEVGMEDIHAALASVFQGEGLRRSYSDIFGNLGKESGQGGPEHRRIPHPESLD